jgi:hypothetical protein
LWTPILPNNIKNSRAELLYPEVVEQSSSGVEQSPNTPLVFDKRGNCVSTTGSKSNYDFTPIFQLYDFTPAILK